MARRPSRHVSRGPGDIVPSVAPVPRWSAWRTVIWFGLVSLAADMVYEGARSLYGPLLAALGAGATTVGLVTGAGEAMALVLRLVFGPLADRTGSYWALTFLGYGLTAVCVPLLAVAPLLGGAGLAVAATLILLERSGKAVRSPSKTALLAQVAASVGRGRGFGIHKALDQTGAVAGPLLVAAVVALSARIWPGLAVLAIPGAIAMGLLAVIRWAVPDPGIYEEAPAAASATPAGGVRGWVGAAVGAGLPQSFIAYAVAASLTTGGLVTYGLIGYHMAREHVVPIASVPLVYAGAMAMEAVAALVIGGVYDRIGGSTLYVVPLLVALVPALVFTATPWVVLVGVAVWGFAFGIQDSTIKALVAELVEAPRRATAYGVFAGIQGAFALGGGVLAGWLYGRSVTELVVVVACTQALALVILARTIPGARRRARP